MLNEDSALRLGLKRKKNEGIVKEKLQPKKSDKKRSNVVKRRNNLKGKKKSKPPPTHKRSTKF